MTDPARFLNAMGKALSAMSLYAPSHPMRQRAVQLALASVRELQRGDSRSSFSFLTGEVVHGDMPLHDMRDWEWGERFTRGGIQRIEFIGAVDEREFEDLLHELMARVIPGWTDPRPPDQRGAMEYGTIRFGALVIRADADHLLGGGDAPAGAGMSFGIAEEAEMVDFLHRQVEDGRALPAPEAEAVVSSLAVAMHGDQQILLPLLELRAFDQYTTVHSLNVAVLAMGLAEFLGLGTRDTRAIGVAGLLRDIGMTRVPKEIVTKAGPPTEQEWEIIRRHPVEGAKIILASEPQLDIAAVVAYEHHMLSGGGGYPKPYYERDLHYVTKLVQICDVYDALRTRRFHRGAWSPDNALRYVEEKAGTAFDAELAKAFVTMMTRWERRVVVVDRDTPITAPPLDSAPDQVTTAASPS